MSEHVKDIGTLYWPGERKGNKSIVIRGSIEGHQREITTGERNKKPAIREFIRRRDAAASRRELGESPPPTFREAVVHYRNTGTRSEQQLAFIDVLLESRMADMPLRDIRPGTIRTIAIELYPGRKPSTWNRNVIVPARAVINAAAEDDWCPHIRVKKFPEQEAVKQQPSDGAAHILIANTAGHRQLYIGALHFQGLRPSEALRMHWDNIDIANARLSIEVPKTGKVVTLAIDDEFLVMLANMPDKSGRVFPWVNRSGTYNWIAPLCKKLGVRFGARMARHQFASDIAASGGSEHDIVNAGSWSSTGAVRHYVELREDRAREVLRDRKKTRNKGKNKGDRGKVESK